MRSVRHDQLPGGLILCVERVQGHHAYALETLRSGQLTLDLGL